MEFSKRDNFHPYYLHFIILRTTKSSVFRNIYITLTLFSINLKAASAGTVRWTQRRPSPKEETAMNKLRKTS
jgi:hypothetical protein